MIAVERIPQARGGRPQIELPTLAIALYKQGVSERKMATQFGISKNAFRRALKRAGVWQNGGFQTWRARASNAGPKSKWRVTLINPVLSEMKLRVRRCLNKKLPKAKEPRPKKPKKFSIMRGMTPAEKFRHYYKTNPKFRERSRQRGKKWAKENPAKLVAYRRDYNNRIRNSAYLRIREWLKLHHLTLIDAIGCTVAEFKLHIENQFEFGMSWDNYGHRGWHIDHKRPLASFNLEDKAQALKATHYTNLRPLWALDNIAKGSKWKGKRHRHANRRATPLPPVPMNIFESI